MIKSVLEKNNLLDQMIKWRRELHQIPETAFEEVKTAAFVKKVLNEIGVEAHSSKNGTGVIALLQGDANSKTTIGLRAELDGLPITEMTELPYSSHHEGNMHACGHDVHMSILLGLAKYWRDLANKPSINLLLIFQPAEEKPPGGAKDILSEPLFIKYKPNWMFALHVHPFLETGRLGIKEETTMAAYDLFDLTVKGKGGHAATPHKTNDSIIVSGLITQAWQSIVSRQTNPLESVVLSVGDIKSAGDYNIIPESVNLKGTIRTLTEDLREEVPLRMENVATSIAASFGCRAEFHRTLGYPPVVNHKQALDYVYSAGGSNIHQLGAPLMAGDDFAYYLKDIPGAYVFLGAAPTTGAVYPWHSPNFDIDENSMLHGVNFLINLMNEFKC